MHAEEFLLQVREIDKEIKRQEAIADSIRHSLEPKGVRYDQDKVQSTPEDPIPKLIARLDEKLTEIRALRVRRAEIMHSIDRLLDRLGDADERTALTHWYMLGEREEIVSEALLCSTSTMYRIKARALQHVEALLKVDSD